MQSDTTLISNLPNNIDLNIGPVQNKNELNEESKKIENYGELLNKEKSNIAPINNSEYSNQLNSVMNSLDKSVTNLPSRDIPSNTINLQNDYLTKQNEIPINTNDYIGNIIDKEKILNNNQKKENINDNLDYIFNEIKIPLLLFILYFIFQLPFIRKKVLYTLPMLFNKDGNQNIYGYVFYSLIFSISYYILYRSLYFL